jgi:hypothetical protein
MLVALDVGLDLERSEFLVIIQIFTQTGRKDEAKQQFFAHSGTTWTLWVCPDQISARPRRYA